MLKNNKGITLLSLMIVVIILLILLGLSINIIISNDVFNKTEKIIDEANDKSASQEDAEFETIDTYEEEEGKSIIIGPQENTEEEEESETTTITKADQYLAAGKRAYRDLKYKDSSGNIAIIPEGFTVSGIAGEKTINDGLVIYDIPEGTTVDWSQVDTLKTTYNQFVWIPVAYTKQGDEDNNGLDDGFESIWKRNIPAYTYEGSGSQYYVEPLTSNNYDETNGIKSQLDEMAQSVEKYGGFYIARYEAGTNVVRNDESGVTKLQFVQDAYPYNYVKWGESQTNIGTQGAVYLSKNLKLESEASSVSSMLCSGVAWDAMLKFLEDTTHSTTSSKTWGNYKKTSFYVTRGKYSTDGESYLTVGQSAYTKPDDTAVLLTTGATERNKSKNIYDVAGNCSEITTEAYTYNDNNYRVNRGTNYITTTTTSYMAIYRNQMSITATGKDRSFRTVLYLNKNI